MWIFVGILSVLYGDVIATLGDRLPIIRLVFVTTVIFLVRVFGSTLDALIEQQLLGTGGAFGAVLLGYRVRWIDNRNSPPAASFPYQTDTLFDFVNVRLQLRLQFEDVLVNWHVLWLAFVTDSVDCVVNDFCKKKMEYV